MNVPVSIGLALLLAILLNGAIPGRGVFRTIFYLPHIIPIVAVVWIWRIFVDQNYGLLNGLLGFIWPDTAIRWTVDYPTQVLTALTVWMGIGGGMVIFLAGLQGIPSELKEAARIDGATTFQLYRGVIVPLLTPVIFFELVLTMIRSLQTLVAPMLLAGEQLASIPARDNYLLLVHAYQQVFAQQRYGYGLALIWMFLVVIVALTYAVFRSSRFWVYYEVDQHGTKA
jgi:multiple sugar transport system permease protein